jgi:hypothetical protein
MVSSQNSITSVCFYTVWNTHIYIYIYIYRVHGITLSSGFTAKNGARKGVLDIGVLVTDGVSTFRKKTLQETKLCKKAGIQLFAIGVAIPTNVEIQQIGSRPKKDHVFTIKHFPDLLHKARDIHHKMCENINKARKRTGRLDKIVFRCSQLLINNYQSCSL